MRTRFNPFKLIVMCALLASVPVAKGANQEVTATLDQSTIELGDTAQLTITISGADNVPPVDINVSGLDITCNGQSRSFQLINGSMSSSLSLIYQITPERTGTFAIPPFRLPGGTSSQPLTLRVIQRAGGSPSSLGSNLPPPNLQSGTNNGPASSTGQAAFLKIELPKRELYTGERVPVQIKAFFRAGMAASLNGMPVLSSDALEMNKLSDRPKQTQEIIGNLPYTVLTWTTTLSAVKAGDYSLGLQLPIVVRVRERRQRGNDPFKQFFGNSPFQDPFMDDPMFNDFFGAVTQKQITLRTDPEQIRILTLPDDGRPAEFSGAVGKFEASAEASPAQLSAGDPVTLRLKVSGQGNFDRVYSRGLEASDDWKTYSPGAHFEPADSVGYAGAKIFEQAVIPLKAGNQEIPPLKFSYFDPETRQYVTKSTGAIGVSVAPGSGAPNLAQAPAATHAPGAKQPAVSTATDLAPNQVEMGGFVPTLRPVLFAPWFAAAQAVPVAALLAGLFIHRQRERMARDPARIRDRAARAAMREQLAAMDEALNKNNAPAFFSAARQLIQEQLGRCWQLPASQVTSAEVVRRLKDDAADLRGLFAVADDVAYSGRTVPPAELQQWKQSVILQLRRLEAV